MLPPAPGLFSTMNGCLSEVVIFSSTMRANVSSGPGTVLTMTRTGFDGYTAGCANAPVPSASKAAAAIRLYGLMRAPPLVESSLLDVRLDEHAVLAAEQILERLQRRERALRVLLAVAAREPDAADHLAVHHDRKAADEGGEAAFEAELDAEGFVARQRRPVRRLGEEMCRALVSRGGKGLVPGDLSAGDARAVHALEREWIAAFVDHAHGLRHA